MYKVFSLLLIASLFFAQTASAQVIGANRGGTGTSTPRAGYVLIGNGTAWNQVSSTSLATGGIDSLGDLLDVSVVGTASGSVLLYNGSQWVDMATSSLGISGGAGGADGVSNWLCNGTRCTPSSTVGISVNASSSITKLNALEATSTHLAVSGAFNFLGTLITDVTTWFNSLFDTRLGGSNVDALNDVNVTGAASGTVLVFDGNAWSDLATSTLGLTEIYTGSGPISVNSNTRVISAQIATSSALAANGANCSAGSFPLGVDASGAAESCTDAWTEAENTSAGYISGITGESIFDLSDVLGSSAASGTVFLSDGTNFNARATGTIGFSWDDLRDIPAGFADGTDDGSGGGSADGVSNWLYTNGRLTPSTTVGIGVFASSTIGDGSSQGGLTVSGRATTTDLVIVSGLYDSDRQIGSKGQLLSSRGTSTLWLATSTLGIDLDDVRGLLSIAKGGTGLTSVGASNTILVSNGSSWVSRATSTFGILTQIDTCAEIAALVSGETGTCGSLVLSASPTFTGVVTYANATGSEATSTRFYSKSLTFTAASGTDASSTNLYAKNSLFAFSSGTAASSTNVYGTVGRFLNLVVTTLATFLDIAVNGTATFLGLIDAVDIDVSGVATTTDLALNGKLHMDTSPLSDHSANGNQTNDILAGETIAAMDLVFLNTTGRWRLADADTTASSTSMLAIALEAGTAGNPVNVALPGSFVRDDSWSFASSSALYVGTTTSGSITSFSPSATDEVDRTVGYAISPTTIFFNPSGEYLVLE